LRKVMRSPRLESPELPSGLNGPSAPATPNLVWRKPGFCATTTYPPAAMFTAGQTEQHRVLLAMRASKLRAYQELAAVVHGQHLYGTTQVNDMIMQNDRFRAAVAGIVRGARVVKAYPVQDDTYATTLELDLSQVQRAWVVNE
jgi:hypothetical protein